MKLVYEHNGQAVKEGDITKTFRGEPVVVTDFREPHKPSSTGRVWVKFLDSETDEPVGYSREFFPGVIGAKWTA